MATRIDARPPRWDLIPSLVRGWPDDETRRFLIRRATSTADLDLLTACLVNLTPTWPDDEVQTLLSDAIDRPDLSWRQNDLIKARVAGWPNEETRLWLLDRVAQGESWPELELLAQHFPDRATRQTLLEVVHRSTGPDNAPSAIGALADFWTDDATRAFVVEHAENSNNWLFAMHAHVRLWRDETTRALLGECIRKETDDETREELITILVHAFPDQRTRDDLVRYAREEDWFDARIAAMRGLDQLLWTLEESRLLDTNDLAQPLDDFYLERFMKEHGYDLDALFTLADDIETKIRWSPLAGHPDRKRWPQPPRLIPPESET